jgi:2-phosphosulfolactate phosphatase
VAVQVDLELWARDAGKALHRGDLVIVIDALRSGTSILNALNNGAEAVIPVESLKQACRLRSQHPDYLLAGERMGEKPAGFDFGNSPLEFTSDMVAGRTLVMTTTSGTAALVRSQRAHRVLVGTFLNAGAVAAKAESVAENERIGVSFVLAGEKGLFSLEDFLCAGAIAEGFAAGGVRFSDKAQAALLAFKQVRNDLEGSVMEAEHAKHLVKLGFKGDVVFSCRLDVLRKVPVYGHNRITLQE